MDRTTFLARVEEYHMGGWRLALINATSAMSTEEQPGGSFDVVWAFAKDNAFEYLREEIVPGDEVPSISNSFPAAFLYENEIRELFGINVTGLNVDLGGQLYKTAQKIPFSPSAIRARLEANAAAGIASASATPPSAPHGAAPAASSPAPTATPTAGKPA
jgi:ech hydrogenase subunit D